MKRFVAALFAAVALFAGAQTLQGFTVVRTFGPVTLNAGADGFLFNAAGSVVPAGASQVLVMGQQGNDWPLVGGPALKFSIDYSNDGGATWSELASDTIDDVAQGGFTHNGIVVAAGQFFQVTSIPEVGTTGRRLRVHYHFYKALTVSGDIEGQ